MAVQKKRRIFRNKFSVSKQFRALQSGLTLLVQNKLKLELNWYSHGRGPFWNLKLSCSGFSAIYTQYSVFSCKLKSYGYLILSGERPTIRKEYARMTERSTEEVQCSFMENVYLYGIKRSKYMLNISGWKALSCGVAPQEILKKPDLFEWLLACILSLYFCDPNLIIKISNILDKKVPPLCLLQKIQDTILS